MPGEKEQNPLKINCCGETRRPEREINACRQDIAFVDLGFRVISVAFHTVSSLLSDLCFYCAWELPSRWTKWWPGVAEMHGGSSPARWMSLCWTAGGRVPPVPHPHTSAPYSSALPLVSPTHPSAKVGMQPCQQFLHQDSHPQQLQDFSMGDMTIFLVGLGEVSQ